MCPFLGTWEQGMELGFPGGWGLLGREGKLCPQLGAGGPSTCVCCALRATANCTEVSGKHSWNLGWTLKGNAKLCEMYITLSNSSSPSSLSSLAWGGGDAQEAAI